MLFNSPVFVFVFLPVTLAGFALLRGRGRGLAVAWLVVASLVFYGWWNPAHVPLLVGSIVANWLLGGAIRAAAGGRRRALLVVGIAGNLALIAWFKYAGFTAANLGLAGFDAIVLPLAISFFTFQQIAYLVDAHRGETHGRLFLDYALFVLFFPQLIAGPIVHHGEVIPQFARWDRRRRLLGDLLVGATIFAIGLFKKAVIADSLALQATPMFTLAANGFAVGFFDSWAGALAYTFQIYFDFSGYSDMAIGLGRMFGVRLPLNFHSPYKAAGIAEFWRRWHMTLSRFLRDYLYIPLGGGRRGPARTHVNLMIVMLLGGLWHGAGWTFVVWGGLHGVYLVVQRAWSRLAESRSWRFRHRRPWRLAAWALTFLGVVVAWVFFRARDIPTALGILNGMAGLNGLVLPPKVFDALGALAGVLGRLGIEPGRVANIEWPVLVLVPGAALIAFLLPNSQQIMARVRPALDPGRGLAMGGAGRLGWRPTVAWGVACGLIGAVAVLGMTRQSEFLYFQF